MPVTDDLLNLCHAARGNITSEMKNISRYFTTNIRYPLYIVTEAMLSILSMKQCLTLLSLT